VTTPPDSALAKTLLRYVAELVEQGGRTAGSEGERIAQERLAGMLHNSGFEARVEGAVCPPPQYVVLVLHAAMALFAAMLIILRPGWGILLTAITGLSFWGELRGYPRILRRLLPRRISGNLVARLPNKNATGRILLVAHVDTASSSALFHPIVKTFLRRREGSGREVHPGTLVLIACVVQVLAGVLSVMSVAPLWPTVALGVAVVVHLGVLVIGLDWWRSPPVVGAVDNGSGLAVVRSLADRLVAQPTVHAEVWIVATGDREPEAGGMTAFLRRFGRVLDLESTMIVNIDDVGRGRLHFAVSEGRWDRIPYRPTLPALAERVATRPEFRDVRSVGLVGTTDAGPATRAGYRAVTLTSLVGGRRAEVLHTARDSLDALETRSLEEAHRFALALVREIDRFLGESEGNVPGHVGAAPPVED
jgi:hypothetical protein